MPWGKVAEIAAGPLISAGASIFGASKAAGGQSEAARLQAEANREALEWEKKKYAEDLERAERDRRDAYNWATFQMGLEKPNLQGRYSVLSRFMPGLQIDPNTFTVPPLEGLDPGTIGETMAGQPAGSMTGGPTIGNMLNLPGRGSSMPVTRLAGAPRLTLEDMMRGSVQGR